MTAMEVKLGKRIKEQIGRHNFPSRTAANKHYSNMLNRYEDGDKIDAPEDHEDLVALIKHYDVAHIEAGLEPKQQGKILYFKKMRDKKGWGKTSCFHLVCEGDEPDGTDFSLYAAIKQEVDNIMKDFSDACRNAVKQDINRTRAKYFEQHADTQGRVACDITGTMITIPESHMDHAWPKFSRIVADFLDLKGWFEEIPDGIISKPENNQTTTTFIDDSVMRDFANYHKEHAVLRLLSKSANLKAPRSKVKPEIKTPIRID